MKQCNKCLCFKPLDDFYKMKSHKDGKHGSCKDCVNSYMRNRYKNVEGVRDNHLAKYKKLNANSSEHRKQAKQRSSKFYSSTTGRARTLLNNARKAPISKILECTVSLEHIIKGIEQSKCPMTGFEFDLSNSYQTVTGRSKNPFAPSIDRINPSLGYEDENTRIVIWQYNLMKGEMSDAEVLYFCTKILELSQ